MSRISTLIQRPADRVCYTSCPRRQVLLSVLSSNKPKNNTSVSPSPPTSPTPLVEHLPSSTKTFLFYPNTSLYTEKKKGVKNRNINKVLILRNRGDVTDTIYRVRGVVSIDPDPVHLNRAP